MNKFGVMALGFVACMSLVSSPAKADGWDQKTRFTFSGPVEIPGHQLSAGTYVFKIVNSASDRDVVQVYNENETHSYGIFLAIPDYRLKPTGKPIVTFSERPADSPEAVRAWFYPGENYGHEFVYPKSRAAALARANHQAVASTSDEWGTDEASARKARLRAQKPTGEDTDVPDAFGAPPGQSGTRK